MNGLRNSDSDLGSGELHAGEAGKETRSALQNAASIANLILTTDAMIAEFLKNEGKPDAMGEMER